MITKADYKFELTHLFGGNGWAVLEDMGNEYVRLISVGGGTVGNWTPVSWTKLLSRTRRKFQEGPDAPEVEKDLPISPAVLALIDERRQQLKK